jgi:hypothetical protein
VARPNAAARDQERAAAVIFAVAGAQDGGAALAEVVDAFGAVRLDERRAIAAWLRTGVSPLAELLLGDVAGRIERGEHGGEA